MQKNHWRKKLVAIAIVVIKLLLMNIVKFTNDRRDEIIQLLQSQNLPSDDLPAVPGHFYVALEEDNVIGLIGMERYNNKGLLRSMVVHPGYRNLGIAEGLIRVLEEEASSAGITSMYLLTETADKYFSKKGYETVARNDVPDDVKSSSEFSHVCPLSAVAMRKNIGRTPGN